MFRKGAVLLTTEEMESEFDGEELRKEVCLSNPMSILGANRHLYSYSRLWLSGRLLEWWMNMAQKYRPLSSNLSLSH